MLEERRMWSKVNDTYTSISAEIERTQANRYMEQIDKIKSFPFLYKFLQRQDYVTWLKDNSVDA